MHRLSAVVVSAALGTACPAPTPQQRCNGSEALCARRLDEVSFAAAHNAMSSSEDGFSAPNQNEDIAGQLALGVRAFLVDTHVDADGVPALCHNSCALGAVSLASQLEAIGVFLDDNPGEVLQLLIQDEAPASAVVPVFDDTGLSERMIAVDPAAPLPTLSALIDDDTRVLATVEGHSERTGAPAWYLPMFDAVDGTPGLFSDTPFSFTSPDELAADGSCDLNRGVADAPLFLVNHWAEDPFADPDVATAVNAASVLDERLARCEAERGRRPSVVAVDFADLGDVVDVVTRRNTAR